MQNISMGVIIILVLLVGYLMIQGGDSETVFVEESVLEKVKDSGKLYVGYAIYPPYIQKDLDTGELSGYTIDLVENIADQMGVEVEYVESSWQSFASDLQTDRYDLFAGPLFSTIKRSMEIDFPTPYGYFSSVAGLVREDDFRFNEISDLDQKGVIIAVPQGWSAHEYAIKHFTKATIKSFKQEGPTLALIDVINGNSDVSLADGPAVQQYLENNPNQKVKPLFLDNPPAIVPAGFGIRKGDSVWLEFLDQSVENLRVSGDLDSLAKEYKLYSYDIKNEFVLQ